MLTRIIQPGEAVDWARMRNQLWPGSPTEHEREIATFFGGDRRDPAEVILAIDTDGCAVGFAEVTIRSHSEGCTSDRIAYLEGWFVEVDHRGRGAGAFLIKAVEDCADARLYGTGLGHGTAQHGQPGRASGVGVHQGGPHRLLQKGAFVSLNHPYAFARSVNLLNY